MVGIEGGRFSFNFLLVTFLCFFFLVEALDGEFDVVGFPIGVLCDESIDDSFHLLSERRGVLLRLVLRGLLRAPALGIFVLVTMVVGHVDDFGALQLEGMAFVGELAAVGSERKGFSGCLVGDFGDAGFCRFDGLAQCAQFL